MVLDDVGSRRRKLVAQLNRHGGVRSAVEEQQGTESEAASAGTAHYLAPEVVGGNPATAQSDLYALGVVLYRLLTGRLPLEGNNPLEVAMLHAPRRSRSPAISCRKCLPRSNRCCCACSRRSRPAATPRQARQRRPSEGCWFNHEGRASQSLGRHSATAGPATRGPSPCTPAPTSRRGSRLRSRAARKCDRLGPEGFQAHRATRRSPSPAPR